MYIQQKDKLLKLLNTAMTLQEKLPNLPDLNMRVDVLTKCQEVAITIGEALENVGGDDKGIVHLLEEYCEMIFSLSQLEQVSVGDIGGIKDKLLLVYKLIEEFPTKYRVVFLPYKADMWDSLESIWRACVADPRCECDVVPIPYFEFNRQDKKWEPRYDGARFPKDVPVIHYDYYRMDEMQPDIAYIHNPYDDCNHVTTVHPYYYSGELKKNVSKLVYVPYYANAGFIAPEQQAMPVCRNMDYMVVQSEMAKESCKGAFFYNKILPFGSPKFDNVIIKSKSEPDVPIEWKPIISGKKVLMLNTTINDLLLCGETLINKLKYFFEIISKQSKVVLIWRPHPLLEATIKSMRPHLLQQYKELQDIFNKNKIGIYDMTGDVSNTVAISDCYVGSVYSSVINLFGVCGKPIFLFDNLSYNGETAGQFAVSFGDLLCVNDKVYGICKQWGNSVVEMLQNGECKVLADMDESKWHMSYYSVSFLGNKLFLSPFRASHAAEFNIRTCKIKSMNDVGRSLGVRFLKNVAVGNKIYYMPQNDFLMMEYDTVTDKWSYHTECIAKLWEGCNFTSGMWRVTGAASNNNSLWITTGHANKVLCFNAEDATYSVYTVGEAVREYSEVVADDVGLWLADGKTGEIIRWIYGDADVKSYPVPDGYHCWKEFTGIIKSVSKMLDMGRYLITVPGHANYMVRFDKITGESKLLVKEFWEHASETIDGFSPNFVTTGGACVKLDDTHIMVQRKCDCTMAKIDVVNNTFEQVAPVLSDEDFKMLMKDEDGFEKATDLDYFCRRESKIFTVQGFIDDLVEGRLDRVRERQLRELSTLAANLDGTCGQKVHEFMMNVLEEEK